MGKPKHYWYGIVKRLIMESPSHDKEESLQQYIISMAMEKANKETLKLPNGEERLRAVELVLIKKNKNVYGAALELYCSSRKVERWISSYINLVGRKAGF